MGATTHLIIAVLARPWLVASRYTRLLLAQPNFVSVCVVPCGATRSVTSLQRHSLPQPSLSQLVASHHHGCSPQPNSSPLVVTRRRDCSSPQSPQPNSSPLIAAATCHLSRRNPARCRGCSLPQSSQPSFVASRRHGLQEHNPSRRLSPCCHNSDATIEKKVDRAVSS
ncbi:hypothetical protein NL676_021346 [Syzygium grande]|nr:hypothetical protein NL676_021346 [Syzygium grande]